MRYGSVCSGIEAATVAWHPLGWTPVFFAEVEPFPCAVLAHHYPEVPNHGDITRFREWPDADIDVLVGGTPCQSFSVAGLRGGMADPRGNLALTFLAIADRYRPEWLVWENVPGVLSSNGGRDFGSILGGMVELGYGVCYRVLDAQYFGVAQRRRRVFVVGHAGDWHRAAAVLLEPEGLRGDSAPRREAGQRPSGSLAARTRGGGGLGTDLDGGLQCVAGTLDTEYGGGKLTHQSVASNHVVPCFWNGEQVSQTLDAVLAKGQTMPEKNRFPAVLVPGSASCSPASATQTETARSAGSTSEIAGARDQPNRTSSSTGSGAGASKQNDGDVAHSLRADGFDASEDGTGRGTPLVPVAFDLRNVTSAANRSNPQAGDPCHTLHKPADSIVAFESRFARNGRGAPSDVVPPLKAQSGETGKGDAAPLAQVGMMVRRLTPVECSRLQGFPDRYLLDVPYRGKAPPADGPMYKALGNSMAVPVMRWIGEQIDVGTKRGSVVRRPGKARA